jgi:hypothetical protein
MTGGVLVTDFSLEGVVVFVVDVVIVLSLGGVVVVIVGGFTCSCC